MPDRATRVDILFGLAYPDSRVRRAAQALAGAGYDVRVLAWDRGATRARREHDGSVRVEHVRVRSHSGRGVAQLPFLVRALARHLPRLRADPPDVLHAVDLPMLAAALTLRPIVGRPRLVYDAFELYAVMEAHKYPGWLLSVIDRAERWLPRHADLVLTPAEARRDHLATRGVPSVVVGNWMDAPDGPPHRDVARRELDIQLDRFCVVYVGGLEQSRDLEPLVSHARRTPSDVVFVAGRGEQEAQLAAAAAELPNLRFVGWVADPGPVYAAADAIYYALRVDHPYAAHAAPNNLYAAIAWGVPLLHRGQGEIGRLASMADIGEDFGDTASLDLAIDALREPARQAQVRSELRGLQGRYSARRAAEALLDAYPLPPRLPG